MDIEDITLPPDSDSDSEGNVEVKRMKKNDGSSIPTKNEEKKKKKKPRKPAYNQRAEPNEELAKQYQHLGLEYHETEAGEMKWHKLATDVLLQDIESELLKNPFTCCNWDSERFTAFKGAISRLEEVGSGKKYNPYHTLRFPAEVLKEYKGHYCGTSTFKVGCASKLCRESKVHCTAHLKIKYLAKSGGKTCDIFVWGKHSPIYYPNKLNLRPRKAVLNKTKIAIQSNARPGSITKLLKSDAELIGDPENVSLTLPERVVSSMKSNEKRRQFNHSLVTFEETIGLLKDLNTKSKEIRVIERIEGVHFTNMKKR